MKRTKSARRATASALRRWTGWGSVLLLVCTAVPQAARAADLFAFCWASDVGPAGKTTHFYSAVFEGESSSRSKYPKSFDEYLREEGGVGSPESLCFARRSEQEAEAFRKEHEEARPRDFMAGIRELPWKPGTATDIIDITGAIGNRRVEGGGRRYFGEGDDDDDDDDDGRIERSAICRSTAGPCEMYAKGLVGAPCWCQFGWYTYYGQIVRERRR